MAGGLLNLVGLVSFSPLDLELEYKMKLEKAKRLREFINSKIAFNFEKLLG